VILGSVRVNFILLMLFSQLNLYVPNLAVAQSSPSSTEVVVIGFLFVLLVLSALGIVTALLGRIFQAVDCKDKASGQMQTPEQAVPVVSSASHELPKDVQAVIIAAVHTVLEERPHRIVRVKEVL
jgi:Na+-transporting methylmalonyl-CoA/oxaloacetate decarboxylase gamma subunit